MSSGGEELEQTTDSHTLQPGETWWHHFIDQAFTTLNLSISSGAVAIIIAAWIANRCRKNKGRKNP